MSSISMQPSSRGSAGIPLSTDHLPSHLAPGQTVNLVDAAVKSSPLPPDLGDHDVATQNDDMILTDLAKPILAHRRRMLASSAALTPYEADLTSKDRARQKDAVKRYLAEKVHNDWDWIWPRDSDQDDSSSGGDRADTHATYDDWRDRDDWLSELIADSDDDDYVPAAVARKRQSLTGASETSTTDGSIPVAKICLKKHKLRKDVVDEMRWNDGLQCFTERRNAWTGARHVAPASPDGVLLCDVCHAELPPPAHVDADLDVQVPVAAPLLPASNPMRSSIGPAAYTTIYDKVIIQGLTPACPINLSDVLGSCVEGWKRDGEWPPKPAQVEPSIAVKKDVGRKRRSIVGLLGLEREKTKAIAEQTIPEAKAVPLSPTSTSKGSLRKSFQKVLSLRKLPSREGEAPER